MEDDKSSQSDQDAKITAEAPDIDVTSSNNPEGVIELIQKAEDRQERKP